MTAYEAFVKALGAAINYVNKTIAGTGALKGKNCTIDSIVQIEGGHRITFKWTEDDGTVETETMDVMDGEDDIFFGTQEEWDALTEEEQNEYNFIFTTDDEETFCISIPEGGTAGQVLVKKSGEDYDTEWEDWEKWANERLSTTYGNKFKKFCDNMDIDYEYDSATGANYSVIRIYRDRLDGKKQFPFVYAPDGAGAAQNSTYDLQLKDGWFLAINSGIFNASTHEPDGIVVENGVVIHDGKSTTLPQCRPLVIDENGEMSEAAYDADANTLVQNGAVSVVCGFMAIVKDYEAVPQSEWNSIGHYTQNAQRQIIGQFGNGDYAIVTCEGRDYQHSDGWTIAEAQTICLKLGLKFAYNLDGGGSAETMIGFKHFNTIYENTTGRKVPTFIVFNGGNAFTKPERPIIYPSVIKKVRFGPIYSADGSKKCHFTANRASIWADGVTGLAFTNNGVTPGGPYYAVEVPSNATAITVTIPNRDVGVVFCDSNGTKAWDVGWRDANEGLKLAFDMGKYAYVTFNVRNKNNSDFIAGEDTSDWAVMFETTQQ